MAQNDSQANQDFQEQLEQTMKQLISMLERSFDILEQQDPKGEHAKELEDMRKKLEPYKEKYMKK